MSRRDTTAAMKGARARSRGNGTNGLWNPGRDREARAREAREQSASVDHRPSTNVGPSNNEEKTP